MEICSKRARKLGAVAESRKVKEKNNEFGFKKAAVDKNFQRT
jgi:hypothetical protein